MAQFNLGGITFGRNPIVKSVQYGSITLFDGESTDTATINAITTSNSVVMHLGQTSNGTDMDDYFVNLVITDSTTITANMSSGISAGDTLVVTFCIIEFYGGVLKSNQSGNIFLEGTDSIVTNTATINAVDTNKAILFSRGSLVGGANIDQSSQAFTNITLTNTTTITATRSASGGASTDDTDVYFQIIEFY